MRVEPGQTCGLHPPGAVVDLLTRKGREKLRTRVWGSPSLRSQLRQTADRPPFEDGFLSGLANVVFPQQPGNVLPPIGVERAEPRGESLAGTVSLVQGEIGAPLSDEQCVAWGVTFRRVEYSGSGPVMLRDGRCTTFDVNLDDKGVVRVLAGRCRVDGTGRRYPDVERDAGSPCMPPDPDADAQIFPLIPVDAADETLVREGDRVLLRADLGEADGSYRERARFVAGGPVSLCVVG